MAEVEQGMPELGKNLLKQLRNKEISIDEFNFECAYWLTQFISDCRFEPYPDKPIEIRQYIDKKAVNSKYEVKDEFWRQGIIVRYIERYKEVYAKNMSNLFWLVFMKKHIPKEDTINQKRVSAILQIYKDYYDEEEITA